MDAATRDLLLARYYELEYGDYREDVDFYMQYALSLDPERRLPVLELGCGTGRVALALAEAGFRVVGVDSSAGMLGLLGEKAGAFRLGGRVKGVQSDMRDLSQVAGSGFNMAFCALNTFSYLRTTEDQLATLEAVRGKLVQHGILLLDLTPPLPRLIPPEDGEVVHQGSYKDTDGSIVHKFVTGIALHATQIHDVTIFYDREGPDGTLQRLSQQISFRWTGRYEMDLLLEKAGYKVEKVYGSYELDEYGDESERMIFIART